jgi:hypothetical protein
MWKTTAPVTPGQRQQCGGGDGEPQLCQVHDARCTRISDDGRQILDQAHERWRQQGIAFGPSLYGSDPTTVDDGSPCHIGGDGDRWHPYRNPRATRRRTVVSLGSSETPHERRERRG